MVSVGVSDAAVRRGVSTRLLRVGRLGGAGWKGNGRSRARGLGWRRASIGRGAACVGP